MADGLSVDSLSLVQKTAVEAAEAGGKVEFLIVPDGSRRHVCNVGGALVGNDVDGLFIPSFFDPKPEPRQHCLESVAAVGHFLAHHGVLDFDAQRESPADGGITMAVDPSGPCLYLERRSWSVSVVLDDSSESMRDDGAFLILEPTAEFVAVQALANEPAYQYDQSQMIEFFRFTFAGTGAKLSPECADLLKSFETLQLNDNAEAAQAVGGANYSQTGTIAEMKACEAGDTVDFPDRVAVSFRMFTDPTAGRTVTVICLLFAAANEGQITRGLNDQSVDRAFRFVPLPGELDRAAAEVLADVRAALREFGVPVIVGSTG